MCGEEHAGLELTSTSDGHRGERKEYAVRAGTLEMKLTHLREHARAYTLLCTHTLPDPALDLGQLLLPAEGADCPGHAQWTPPPTPNGEGK